MTWARARIQEPVRVRRGALAPSRCRCAEEECVVYWYSLSNLYTVGLLVLI